MSVEMPDLLPCPFCGSRAIIRQQGTKAENCVVRLYFRLECEKCGVGSPLNPGFVEIHLNNAGELSISHDDRDRVAKSWNRRPEE